jgi:hypothetical protein
MVCHYGVPYGLWYGVPLWFAIWFAIYGLPWVNSLCFEAKTRVGSPLFQLRNFLIFIITNLMIKWQSAMFWSKN